ncbi:MAG: NUDIX hydrolase family protein [Acidimicrobiia bacterium]|nr:NUDIX hydrolase family protein [Acidimicrobiia bacterium]
MADQTETQQGWLTDEDIATVRGRVPIVYVEAVPVRVDDHGNVNRVGLLLRAMPDGTISRSVVSGRVLFGEKLRDALIRNIEKDLGSLALPRIPVDPTPCTVVEYFPDSDVSGFTDPRQHAVSLVYVVPVEGICEPSQVTLDIAWLTPEEADSHEVRAEMTSGQDRLLRLALAHAGCLP